MSDNGDPINAYANASDFLAKSIAKTKVFYASRKWDRKWIIISLLILFWPVGLFALIKGSAVKRKWVTGVICLVVVLVIGYSDEEMNSPEYETVNRNSEPMIEDRETTQTPTIWGMLDSSPVSYGEIAGAKKNMTALRAKGFLNDCIGKTVIWEGYVYDVKKGFFGGYTLYIEMNLVIQLGEYVIGDEDGWDLEQPIDKAIATRLQKSDKVVFKGIIYNINHMPFDMCTVDLSEFEIIAINRQFVSTED